MFPRLQFDDPIGSQFFSTKMAEPQQVSPDVLALNGVLTACEEVTLFACGSGGELRMGGCRVYDTHTPHKHIRNLTWTNGYPT